MNTTTQSITSWAARSWLELARGLRLVGPPVPGTSVQMLRLARDRGARHREAAARLRATAGTLR